MQPCQHDPQLLKKFLKRNIQTEKAIFKLLDGVEPEKINVRRRLEVANAELFLYQIKPAP